MNWRPATCAIGLALALSGCGGVWSDQEYSCTGQDQITSWFENAEAAWPMPAERPMNIDFHLRGKEAMVKTFRATTDTTDPQHVRFHAQGSSAWITGVFDRDQQQLLYVEERQLTLEGRTQTIRTGGRYQCRPVGNRITT